MTSNFVFLFVLATSSAVLGAVLFRIWARWRRKPRVYKAEVMRQQDWLVTRFRADVQRGVPVVLSFQSAQERDRCLELIKDHSKMGAAIGAAGGATVAAAIADVMGMSGIAT